MDVKSRFKKSEQLDKRTSNIIIAVSCIAVSLLLIYFGISLTSKGTFSAGEYCSYTFYNRESSTGRITIAKSPVSCSCPTNWTQSPVSTYCFIDATDFSQYYLDKDVTALQISGAPISGFVIDGNTLRAISSDPNSYPFNCSQAGWTETTLSTLKYCEIALSTYVNRNMPTDVPNPEATTTTKPVTCGYGSLTVNNNGQPIGTLTSGTAAACCPDEWVAYGTDRCVANMYYFSNDLAGYRYYEAWPSSPSCTSGFDYVNQTKNGTLTLNHVCVESGCPCEGCGQTETKTCFKCRANENAYDTQQMDECTGEWSETQPISCQKTCHYCNGTQSSSTVFYMNSSLACSTKNTSTVSYYDSAPNCSTPDPVPVKKDMCYKTSNNVGVAAWVQQCDTFGFTTNLPPVGTSCNGINDESLGHCLISYNNGSGTVNDTVPMCALGSLSDSACALTCYECQSGKTSPQEVPVPLNQVGDTCQSRGYTVTQNSTECQKNCYYCKTGVDGGIKPYSNNPIPSEDNCPSGYYENQSSVPCVQKTCFYCNSAHVSSSTVVWVQSANTKCNTINANYSDTEKTCSKTCLYCGTDGFVHEEPNVPTDDCTTVYRADGTELANNANELSCEATCYKCGSDNVVEVTHPENVTSCPIPTVSNINSLNCKKTCYYCDGNTSASTTLTNSTKDCPATNPNYSNTNNLNCGTQYKTCKFCNGGQVDTNETVPAGTNCSTYDSTYHEVSESLTCSSVCYYCNGTTSASRTVNMDTSKKNCTNYTSPAGDKYSGTPKTCSKRCKFCNSSGQVDYRDNLELDIVCSDLSPISTSKFYEENANITCTKECFYCKNGSVKSKTINMDNSLNCPNGYSNTNDIQCDAGKISCWTCENLVAKPVEVDANQYADCEAAGYEENEPTCSKKCWKCQGTSMIQEDVSTSQACNGTDNYYTQKDNSKCQKKCWRCDGTTPKQDVYTSLDKQCSDTQGWAASESDLTCSRKCYYCGDSDNDGQNDDIVETEIPSSEECSDHNPLYKASGDDLTCSSPKKICYHCDNESVEPIEIEDDDECSNHEGYVTASEKDDLTCTKEKIKCCACEGNKSVEKGEIDEGEECPEGQTLCTEIVCKNSQTGVSAVTIAWIVGLAAIGYSFYYFRKTNKQSL